MIKINKISNNVYEVENFLTKEELGEVYKIIDNTPEKNWFDESFKNDYKTTDFWHGKNLYFKTNNIFDLINNKMKNLFESYSYYPDKMHLQRYKKGDFINYHTDQWISELPYYIGYGFCLYYNDNYAGGELDYPDLKITIKPKANTLYIHGGEVLHGSLPVLDNNIRYFSTIFIHGTKEFPTTLKKELFI
jgi:hypothetical protein